MFIELRHQATFFAPEGRDVALLTERSIPGGLPSYKHVAPLGRRTGYILRYQHVQIELAFFTSSSNVGTTS